MVPKLRSRSLVRGGRKPCKRPEVVDEPRPVDAHSVVYPGERLPESEDATKLFRVTPTSALKRSMNLLGLRPIALVTARMFDATGRRENVSRANATQGCRFVHRNASNRDRSKASSFASVPLAESRRSLNVTALRRSHRNSNTISASQVSCAGTRMNGTVPPGLNATPTTCYRSAVSMTLYRVCTSAKTVPAVVSQSLPDSESYERIWSSCRLTVTERRRSGEFSGAKAGPLRSRRSRCNR